LVEARAESVLVVIAADLPAVANNLEDIGLAAAARVLDARQIAALRHIEPAVLALSEAEDFVQAVGEARELGLLRIAGHGVLDEPDLAAPRADGELVADELKGAGLDHLAGGQLEAAERIVVVLGGRL